MSSGKRQARSAVLARPLSHCVAKGRYTSTRLDDTVGEGFAFCDPERSFMGALGHVASAFTASEKGKKF